MTTNDDSTAVDTNVLLYSLDEFFPEKQGIAQTLIGRTRPVICTQNLSELLNVLTRRWKYPKERAAQTTAAILNSCRYVVIERATIDHAFRLIRRYDFQLFDSLIVAAALQAGCTKFFSEDMHHGLLVENQLLILDPFR